MNPIEERVLRASDNKRHRCHKLKPHNVRCSSGKLTLQKEIIIRPKNLKLLQPPLEDWEITLKDQAAKKRRLAARKLKRHQRYLKSRFLYLTIPWTPSEVAFWNLIEPLHPIFFHHWYLKPYTLDFYCPKANLCIEIDGSSHSRRKRHDRSRDATLLIKGIQTIRIKDELVLKNPESVMRLIFQTIDFDRSLVLQNYLDTPRI